MRKWIPVLKATGLTFGLSNLFLFVGLIVSGWAGKAGMIGAPAAELIVMAVFAVGMMVGAFWIGVEWMRVIDEAAREAHKVAWYWGGTAGLCVSGVAMVLSSSNGAWRDLIIAEIGAGAQPVDYMATGAALMLAPMMIGYTVVWAWWWLARMRG